MQIVNIREAKTHLSRFIDEVSLGEGIVIARAGRPLARLMPLNVAKVSRQLGLRQMQFALLSDFKRRHSDEIQAMFENMSSK
jgi:prevent-host-death family protein